ncbi:2-oxo acid dehydrogenase subunit E2 [Hydrogenothermus marinus]|uniref:Dihydrolipoamide acetyltransferase component of pyruvate dehydrogenase complex n=1 Tax=Hydrogenothermus marinus TaxID=133270 RepID=A0A3M0BQF6_9AQUI|nr:2-oxo acid dehydrogenase subunit E2 [Hydrogenothermus marinus]RMA97058.1 pyruvate dehydrogenase E2 component (dihydrolipoamide acetyltransferase) [Hydrogenothermus marinus]
MDYEITMPRLTDTMETGMIVRWLKNEGDFVKKGEPIVEIETEKAIQEVESFKTGRLKKILAHEGDEVPVGKPIAILELTEEKNTAPIKKETIKTEEKVIKTDKQEKIKKEEIKEEKTPTEKPKTEEQEIKKYPTGLASPYAKKLAAEFNIDIEKLQKEGKLPSPAHEEDILTYYYSEFFEIDALEEAKAFNIDLKEIVENYGKKITKDMVIQFAKERNLYKKIDISQIQKRTIEHLSKSATVPVYHIYETIDVKYIPEDTEYSLTTWIVKITGDVMQNHYRTRLYYDNGKYRLYPSSNIGVAVAVDEELFSPVIKNIELKSLKDIQEDINIIKEKAEKKIFNPEDFEAGTFAISNLGMFGIERFDAVVPYNYSGIMAIGTKTKNKIKITITFDHRIINGREAAIFVKGLKEKFKDKDYIQNLK